MKKIAFVLVAILMTVGIECYAATPYTYCFIGDSRFIGMQQTVDIDENIIWIAKNGAGNDWYWENRDYIAGLNRNTIIIYELGINDLDAIGCLTALKDLVDMGFKYIYFTSITPVDEVKEVEYGYTVTNANIEEFNQIVRENIPYNVVPIDSYEYLRYIGIDTMDGIHYTGYTYSHWMYNILVSL